MWTRLSHTLEPLTKVTSSKLKFKWNKIEKYEFKDIKWIGAENVLLDYPDFNEEINIRNNVRYIQ